MANLTIDLEQRNLLYECFLEHIAGIDDIWRALVEQEDVARAERLSREFSDELLFVLDDLRMGSRSEQLFELTTSPNRLARVLRRYQERAEAADRAEAEELAAVQLQHQRNLRLADTCQHLLMELEQC